MLNMNRSWISLAICTEECYCRKGYKCQCFSYLSCTQDVQSSPNPWEGSQRLQEALLDPQNWMLDPQMVVLQVLQDSLVVQGGPELAQVLLRSPGVQSDLLVLKVHRNVHHIAAEEEPVGGHHTVEARLEPEVPQDSLGQGDLLDMAEQVLPLWVFEGGSLIGSCLLDREEDLQHSAKEHQVLQKQQEQLQGEE